MPIVINLITTWKTIASDCLRVHPDIIPIFPRFFTTLRFLTIAIFTAFVKEQFIRIVSTIMMNDKVLLLHHRTSAAAGTALLLLKKNKNKNK